MKNLQRAIMLLTLVFITSCGGNRAIDRGAFSCQDGPVAIEVVASGLEHAEGQVRMALFATRDGFPADPKLALQVGTAVVEGESARFLFDPVPCGRYAVTVLHDEDGDGEMKTDWLGRPAEGWGISNDVRGKMGPPSFEDASFDAQGETLLIELRMQY